MTETEKKAVGRYLDWHTGILLETDGKMGIYRKESGKLIYKEKADSEDGYLGALSELWVFQEKVDMKVSAFSFNSSLLIFGYL